MNYDEQRKLALRIFTGKKYVELRQAIRDGECFGTLFPLAQKANAIEHWDKFIEEWKYWACREWPCIDDDMRKKAFVKLENEEWIYFAGIYWQGITDKMRIEAFHRLQNDQWIYYAGRYWQGITDKKKIEAFAKLENEEYIYRAGHNWSYTNKGQIEGGIR